MLWSCECHHTILHWVPFCPRGKFFYCCHFVKHLSSFDTKTCNGQVQSSTFCWSWQTFPYTLPATLQFRVFVWSIMRRMYLLVLGTLFGLNSTTLQSKGLLHTSSSSQQEFSPCNVQLLCYLQCERRWLAHDLQKRLNAEKSLSCKLRRS